MAQSIGLRLYFLGGFRLERNCQPVHLPTRKAEALLAYLVLQPEAHSREKLATLLWGDSPDAQARGSLRKALTHLRTQLGNELLLTDRESVQLNPAQPLWADALQLRAHATQLLTEESADLDTVDLDLYRDDLLIDFYEDWIFPWREQFRDLYLRALLHLIRQARSRSQYERAIELANLVLARDRANEDAHQSLMLSYLAIGQRGAALRQFQKCQHALRDELNVEPSPETQKIYQWIKHEIARLPRFAPITNLPMPLTSFIGRKDEMAKVKQLLTDQRLITLTGIGGSGKTRLAIEIAEDLVAAHEFHDGVWWVELASLSLESEALVPQTVARAVGASEVPGQPIIETLIGFLRARQVLLILDNCEHVIRACARLLEQLLARCSNLKVLVTSREAAGIFGETTWRVPPLKSPNLEHLPSLVEMMHYESVHLFCDRARTVAPRFELTVQNMQAIALICQQLDGIPLALELAAARVKVLSVEQIADRLADRFTLLSAGSRTAMPRHQTLRAAIEWSYQLLDEPERALLRRVSVFAGGFTLEAIEAVGQDESVDMTVLDLLSHLIDKSLINVEADAASTEPTRYRLLETIRQYAHDQLQNSGEMVVIQDRHLRFFLEFAERAEPQLFSSEQAAWCQRLEADHDNLRIAMEWAQTKADFESGLRLAGAIWWFWIVRGHYGEGLERLRQLLAGSEAIDRTVVRAKVLHAAGVMYWTQSDFAQALPLFQEALMIGYELGDRWSIALALRGLGGVYLNQGAYGPAQTFLDRALRMWRELQDKYGIAFSLMHVGDLALYQQNYEQAKAAYHESVALFEELQNHNELAYPLRRLAQIAWLQGDLTTARLLLKRALAANLIIDQKRGLAANLVGLAVVDNARGESVNAVRLLGAVDALLLSIGSSLLPADRAIYESNVEALRVQLGDRAFDAAWAQGHALTMDQAITYALNELFDSPPDQ